MMPQGASEASDQFTHLSLLFLRYVFRRNLIFSHSLPMPLDLKSLLPSVCVVLSTLAPQTIVSMVLTQQLFRQ